MCLLDDEMVIACKIIVSDTTCAICNACSFSTVLLLASCETD